MAIEPVPPLDDAPVPGPQRGDESTFDDRMDASIRWQETAPPQFRALGENVKHNAEEAFNYAETAFLSAQSASTSEENAALSEQAAADSATQAANSASSLNSTSTTMLALGTGSMSFATQPGKSYVPGQPMRASDATDLSRRVDGEVFSYNGASGALVLTSTSYQGSGVVGNWIISVTGAGGAQGPAGGVAGGSLTGALNEKKGNDVASAATVDPWAAGGNYFNLTGSLQITAFANAPQAGARRRMLVKDAPSIVSGVDLIVKGGSTFFAEGDEIDVYAETTSRFRVTPVRVDYFFTGDTITTARELTAPTWVLTDGTVYLKTTYPALAALIGSAFVPVKQANPGTLPTGDGHGVSYSPDSVYMAVGHTSAPFITIYKRIGALYSKLANPGFVPSSNAEGTAFSSDGVYMAVAHDTTPFVTIYKRAADVFTKLTNPTTLPGGTGHDVAFSEDTTYLAVANTSGVPLVIYKRAGDVFTKLADPATLPTGNGFSVAFSADGTYLAVGSTGATNLSIYKRAGDVFTRLADPAVLPNGNVLGVSFTPDGNYLVATGTSGISLSMYKRTGDTFDRLSTPSTLPSGGCYSCAFSPDGNTLAVGTGSVGQTASLYRRDGDVLTKLPDFATSPTGTCYGVAFSPDGSQLSFAHTTTPYVSIYTRSYDPSIQFVVPSYQPSANSLKNYIRT